MTLIDWANKGHEQQAERINELETMVRRLVEALRVADMYIDYEYVEQHGVKIDRPWLGVDLKMFVEIRDEVKEALTEAAQLVPMEESE